MEKFKKLLLPMQGHNKNELHWLYDTKSIEAPPKIFSYHFFSFWFEGLSQRRPEKLKLFVSFPIGAFNCTNNDTIPIETFLLHILTPAISKLNESFKNINKNIKEKASFESQFDNGYFAKRSGIYYDEIKKVFVLQIISSVPLENAISVNAKAFLRAVKSLFETIEDVLISMSSKDKNSFVETYCIQEQIREYLLINNLSAFIANGSVLPRQSDTNARLEGAICFLAPHDLEISIPLKNGKNIVGMGIPKGVTVITGGAYSGKSTLLAAIEMGVYNHIPGDGREYVITDNSALMVNSEDGRAISNMNLSPFFTNLPGCTSVTDYSTEHASGSVSQAANIVGAVCSNCKLLLIDEDKSATNFLIRDQIMRTIIKNDFVIPFTDRVRNLSCRHNISSILVVGASSEYFQYADTIIFMENYLPYVITHDIRHMIPINNLYDETEVEWTLARGRHFKFLLNHKYGFYSIKVENRKKICLDNCAADVSKMTTIFTDYQLNTLATVMAKLFVIQVNVDSNFNDSELLRLISSYIDDIVINRNLFNVGLEDPMCFFEYIRPIDVYNVINRIISYS